MHNNVGFLAAETRTAVLCVTASHIKELFINQNKCSIYIYIYIYRIFDGNALISLRDTQMMCEMM